VPNRLRAPWSCAAGATSTCDAARFGRTAPSSFELRAATLDAATLLGAKDLGEIKVGVAGDLVVVEGDPLRDVRLLERPVLLVKGGQVVQ